MSSKDNFLFPGKQQEQRFNRILNQLLEDIEAEVKRLGYKLVQIGLHSIRKGASSYIMSMPGIIFNFVPL
jgi:hypothetical protein